MLVGMPLLGQASVHEGSLPQPGCAFDISEFGRTSRTSAAVIRLQAELIDPNVPVSQYLILQLANESLTDLEGFYLPPDFAPPTEERKKRWSRETREFAGKYLDILVKVLPQKQRAAQEQSVQMVVENQFLRATPMQPDVRRCFQEVMAAIFPTLLLETQMAILNSGQGSYSLFQSTALSLSLRRLYESLDESMFGPSYRAETTLRAYRTDILTRIYEADKRLGREMILQEIASPSPRADIKVLAILPDETIAEIDQTFSGQLTDLYNDADWYGFTAKLATIERYATRNPLQDVKTIYFKHRRSWERDDFELFFSYFLRTDPAFGKKLIEENLKSRSREVISLAEMSHIRVSPGLKEIAKEHLNDPNRTIAADAAYLFRWVGNHGVEQLLWQNLEAWHQEWAAKRAATIPRDEQNYEDDLVEALLFGSEPCESKQTMDKISLLYVKGHSVDGNIAMSLNAWNHWHGKWPGPIRIFIDLRGPSGPRLSVEHCRSQVTIEQFKEAVSGFAIGTEFELRGQGHWHLDATLEPLISEIEHAVRERGMSVHRYEER